MGEGQHGVNENMLPKTPGEETDDETSAERVGKLSLSASRSLAWQAERLLPECMETLVQSERPVLFETACGPDSVLTENMRGMTVA